MSEAPAEPPLRACLLFPWPQPPGWEPWSSWSCRSSGQSQSCCQKTCGEWTGSCPLLPWGHDLVVPAAGCLKQLLTGCTWWIYPLNPMTFSWPDKQCKYFLWSLPTQHFQPWLSISHHTSPGGITLVPRNHHASTLRYGRPCREISVLLIEPPPLRTGPWGNGCLAPERELWERAGSLPSLAAPPAAVAADRGSKWSGGNELVAKSERASGVDHRADFISFLLAPLPHSAARPFRPGLAVIRSVPSFLRAEPQIALVSQGVG